MNGHRKKTDTCYSNAKGQNTLQDEKMLRPRTEFREEVLLFGKFPNMNIFCREEKEEG
jgi:hypothetical protein